MAILIPALETVCAGVLVWLSWRLVAGSPHRNAVGCAVGFCSVAAGGSAASLAWLAAGWLSNDPVVRLGAAAAVGLLALAGGLVLGAVCARRRALTSRLARRFPLSRAAGRLLNLACAVILWLAGAAAVMGSWALAGFPPLPQAVRQHSAVLRHVLPGRPAPGRPLQDAIGTGGRPGPAAPVRPEKQAAEAGPIPLPSAPGAPRSGLLGMVARLTGAVELARWLLCAQDCARLARELSHAERLLALRRLPELRRIADHPRLLALIDDDELRGLAAQCLAGDVRAMARVAEHEKVKALLADESFRREVRSLDLAALRLELASVRLPASRLQPGPWRVTPLREAEPLAQAAEDRDRWRDAGNTGVLVWPPETREGAAVAALHADVPMHVVIYVDTPAPLRLWLNGEALDLTVGPGDQLATADIPAGESVLALAVQLDDANPAPAVRVEVFGEPAAGPAP